MKVDIEINKAYLPYLFSYKNRIEVYYGGAGSGKSIFVAQKIVLKALKGKRKILVVRKVARTQKESCFAVICKILESIKLLNICKINKTTLDITLPNGSIILFKGMDDSEKIKSIADITDIWCEEATELTLDDFSQLNLRLRALNPNLQIFLSFNPVSKANWCYKYFFERETKAFVLHTTYKDNNFLPKDYRKEIEDYKNTNPAYYKIYCLGEFATLDKLIFPIIHKQIINQDNIKHLKFFCGLDFGFTNDPTAIIWGRYDKENKIVYIIGEYFKKGLTNDEIYKTIDSLGLRKEIIIADCAEQKSIEEIRRLGITRIKPCKKFNDSVNFGLQWLMTRKIVIDERLTGIIEEFENYTWQKDKITNEYINKPIDNFNHGIDALRYGLEDIMQNKTARIVDSSKWGGIF